MDEERRQITKVRSKDRIKVDGEWRTVRAWWRVDTRVQVWFQDGPGLYCVERATFPWERR